MEHYNKFFDFFNGIDSLYKTRAREAVVAKEIAEGWPEGQGIGSSDVSAFLYNEFGNCETETELVLSIFEMWTNYVGNKMGA